MKTIMGVIFTLSFLLWAGVRVVNSIQFDRNVGGYLKRAADANTVELAKKNLGVAVKSLEENRLTSGYTSILWRTPDEDIEFWYTNLKASLGELDRVQPDTTQLERTNILIKLRETILDQGESGPKITAPRGISVFPNNMAFAMWCILSCVFAVAFWIASRLNDF